jgi:hypothetical protein
VLEAALHALDQGVHPVFLPVVGAGALEKRLGLRAALGAGDFREIALGRPLPPNPFDEGLRAELNR